MDEEAQGLNVYTHCGHGKKYTEDCDRCEAVWVKNVTLPDMIRSAQRAADFALNHPGVIERDLATAIAHLNRSVSRLAAELEAVKIVAASTGRNDG